MKSNRIIIPLLAAILALTTVHAAEKEKRANISDYPFWTMKKRGAVPQLAPGLNAVLGLTDAQVQQIAAAREEMSNDEAVKAARSIPKSDPNVTAEQREKGRAAMEAASARLREKVAAILTPEQRALIEKINGSYAAAVEETGIVYEDRFSSVKNDEAARKRLHEEIRDDTEELFRHKLDGVLTAAQKEAMARAAKDEESRSAKAAAVKKPAK
jgi:Spy/CpxP family protein refolding chaperone